MKFNAKLGLAIAFQMCLLVPVMMEKSAPTMMHVQQMVVVRVHLAFRGISDVELHVHLNARMENQHVPMMLTAQRQMLKQ